MIRRLKAWADRVLPRYPRAHVEALEQDNAKLRQRIQFLTAPDEEFGMWVLEYEVTE